MSKSLSRNYLLILTIAAVALGSPLQASENPLVGNWEWEELSRPFPSESLTPDSEGYHLQLEFHQDGVLIVYHDGIHFAQGAYELLASSPYDILSTGAIPFIDPFQLDGEHYVQVEGAIGARTLQLSTTEYGGWTCRFVERGPVTIEFQTLGQFKAMFVDR